MPGQDQQVVDAADPIGARSAGRSRPANRSEHPVVRALPLVWMVPIVMLALAPAAAPLSAQSVEAQIRSLIGANAEGYLRPISDGMSFALTGGLFDAAGARSGLSFDLGVRALGAIPDDARRRFTAQLPDTVRWQTPQGEDRLYTDPFRSADGSLDTPSAMGQGPGVILEPAGAFRDDLIQAGENPDDFQLQLPEGLDLSAVPTAILTLSVGVGLGTELQARFLPRVELSGELGRVGARGWGVQHTVSRWFDSPLDISVAVGRQDLEIGDVVDASASEGWLLMGRDLGPLSLFGSAGIRRASVDVEYDVSNPDGLPGIPSDGTAVRFASDLDTTTAFGAGFRLQLLFMNLSGQYTSGDFDTFSVKVGFGVP